jgi:ABC-type ATPase involved in cell division
MIKLVDVYKEYENGTVALDGFDLQIDDGEFVFLVGPSGSGKSTVLKLITGEERSTHGRVMVNGYNMNNIRNWQIPYMFQIRLSRAGRPGEAFRILTIWRLFPNVWMFPSLNS